MLRRLPGSALHQRFDADPFVRWDLARPHGSDIWALGDAIGFQRFSHTRAFHGVSLLGGKDVPMLLDAVLDDLPSTIGGISVERKHLALLQARLGARLGAGGDWDWMWSDRTPPVVPGEAGLIVLDDSRDARAITVLNELGNPTAESAPGAGVTELWLGMREAGELVAAGAVHRTPGGAPHLAGIVVHPRMRGRGVGFALTAALARWAIARSGVCTLGMYADNDRARTIYEGLGFTVAHAWSSRRLLPSDGSAKISA